MAKNVIKTVTLPYSQAFDKLYHVVVNSGYAVSVADPQRGLLKFDSQASVTDWGFNFTAQLGTLSPNATQITFSGDVKFGFDVFKIGNKRIEKLMKSF